MKTTATLLNFHKIFILVTQLTHPLLLVLQHYLVFHLFLNIISCLVTKEIYLKSFRVLLQEHLQLILKNIIKHRIIQSWCLLFYTSKIECTACKLVEQLETLETSKLILGFSSFKDYLQTLIGSKTNLENLILQASARLLFLIAPCSNIFLKQFENNHSFFKKTKPTRIVFFSKLLKMVNMLL